MATNNSTETIKCSFADLKSIYGFNDKELFDVNITFKGKSPTGKPVVSKMEINIEVYV